MQVLYHWLYRLIPANPMVVRIVQGGSRRQRHLWIRMGYLAALIGLVLIGLMFGGGLGGQVSMTDLAKAGARLFAVVAYGQVILVCLLAPLFMAGAIAQEQAAKTYEILLTTPLSNLQIVLGSLLGRLFFVLALVLSGLPLFALLLIFGGVPMHSIFVAFAVAGLTALMVGSVAVTMSVLRVGGRRAVFTFVIAVAAYLVAAYLLDVGLIRLLMPWPNSTTWLTPLHPLLVLQAALSSATYQPPGPEYLAEYPAIVRWYLGRPFAAFAVLSVVGSAVLCLGSAIVLRRVTSASGAARPLPVGAWLRRKLRLMHDTGERRRPPREVWANPIAWREANTRGKVAAGILARWAFVGIALLLAVALLAAHHYDAWPAQIRAQVNSHQIFHTSMLALLLLEVAVVTLVALYMSAGSVSREREDGTLDLLLTTPVTPRQYIWGKLRGLVSFLSLLIAAPVLTLVLASVYALVGYSAGLPQAQFLHSSLGPGGARITHEPLLVLPEAGPLLLLMLVPFVALCVTTGMSWSLKARGVLGAVVPSIGIIGILTLVLGLCGWSAAQKIPLLGPVINAFSPATNVAMLLNPWDNVAAFAESASLGRLSLIIGALVAAAGYSTIVYAMITAMVKGFDQTVRKLSGTG